MPNTKDFRLKIIPQRGAEEDGIAAELQPTPTGNCKLKEIRVNGQKVTNATKAIGELKVSNFGPTLVALKAPKNHKPIRFEFDVDCGGKDEKTFTADVTSKTGQTDAEAATTDFLDVIIGVFKKIADFLGGGFKDLPGDLREALKKIKGLVGKGVDIVSNLLPLAKGIPVTPLAALALLFPDNLDHLKKKIGEHLKDLDPLDDSREAVLADAEALRALILDDVIPYVQQVGAFAMNDLQQYTQRLSVMSKMTARLDDQLDMLGRSGKGKLKKK